MKRVLFGLFENFEIQKVKWRLEYFYFRYQLSTRTETDTRREVSVCVVE